MGDLKYTTWLSELNRSLETALVVDPFAIHNQPTTIAVE
jgi:hypothetical protein